MPQLIVLALAGAGLYAGYKLIAKGLEKAAAQAKDMQDEMRRAAEQAAGAPKDLGALELDETSGVYRPRADRN